MYNKMLAVLVLVVPMLLGAGSVQSADSSQLIHAEKHNAPGNPFDPTTWTKHSGGPMALNFAHPSTWMSFMDPEAHVILHSALMNPVNYQQFVQPHFWMQFANPNNWMAWMNPASYAVMFNPQTYLGWMQPGPWLHFVDPGIPMQMMNFNAYMPFMNPATYMQWMNPAAYTSSTMTAPPGTKGVSWFDPNLWMKSMTPNAAPKAEAPQAPAPEAKAK